MTEFLGFLMQDLRDDGIFMEKTIVQLLPYPPESSFYSIFSAITAGDYEEWR